MGYLEGETFITIAVIDMRNTHFYEIKNIAVDINYQHQGLGRRLMEQILLTIVVRQCMVVQVIVL